MTIKIHEGHRHAFLKAVELALNTGRLGSGDTSDLLDIVYQLGFQYVTDVRLERLQQAVEQNKKSGASFLHCPKCKTGMVLGQAIKTTEQVPNTRPMFAHMDYPITSDTLELIECWKCPWCGHSEEVDK